MSSKAKSPMKGNPEMDIVKEISKKGFDAARIARYAIENPPCIDPLIKGIRAPKGSVRFAYEKVLRLISEQRPDLVYPYWNVFRELSVCDNSILKWGAILILSHLAVVDEDKRLDAVLEEYYAPIQGPMMITAGNIIRGSVTIAAAKPYLIRRITREILRVEEGQYESHGEPSPECRNVAIGHAIDALDQLFDRIEEQEIVLKFVKRQLGNSRKAVVTKAETFLKKHGANN